MEIYDSRNILRSLVAKNLFGKYRNTVLGFGWNFVAPLILLVMYYIVYNEIKGGNIENGWIFISSTIFTFYYLSSSITGGASVFTSNSALIKKMYFPKEILVFSSALSSMIVCLIGNIIVIVLLLITSYPLNYSTIAAYLLIMLLVFVFGIGSRFLLSSIAVYIRDIQYALGMINLALFVMTPMRYMADSATGLLATLIWYNPLTYYIECVHDILYWGTMPNLFNMVMCLLISTGVLIGGYAVFMKLKRGFVKRL